MLTALHRAAIFFVSYVATSARHEIAWLITQSKDQELTKLCWTQVEELLSCCDTRVLPGGRSRKATVRETPHVTSPEGPSDAAQVVRLVVSGDGVDSAQALVAVKRQQAVSW